MSNPVTALIRRLRPHRASEQPALATDETLAGLVWRTTGAHQFYVGLIAIAVAFLNSAPIALQKRIFDGPIAERNVRWLLELAAVYLAVVLIQAVLKYAMLVYQGWISESAVKVSRDEVAKIAADSSTDPDATSSGQTANVIGSEIDRVGMFIGTTISDFIINCASLLMISAYMLYIQPLIAMCALFFLIPQATLATVLQAKLNVLFEKQIGLVRRLGDEVVGQAASDPQAPGNEFRTIAAIYRNRIRFYFLKYGLKTLLNLTSAMGVGSRGGGKPPPHASAGRASASRLEPHVRAARSI